MNLGFISKGGECGTLIRSIDWAKNPLGPIETWPQSLRTTLGILLNSKFPMFLFWGPDLICFYNDAYRPSLGIEGKHPRAMGKPGIEVWPEIWEVIKPLIDQVLSGGEATWSEDQLIPIHRNGKLEEVYWTFSYSPAYDETGESAGVFVTCTESTPKVKSLKALSESKDELEFALNAAELGTWDYNPLTNKFTCNARLRHWFGIASDTEIDLSVALNSIAESDRKKVNEAISKAVDYPSGGNYTEIYTIINSKTGKERLVKAKGKALFNDQNIAYRLNGTLQDITDEVAAQNAFKESEENFRKLILQAPVGMIILNGEQLFVELVNDAYLNIAGKSRSDFAGKTLWEALPESKTLGFDNILKNIMKTGIAHHGNEQPINLIKNGQRQTVYINYVYEPLKDADGSINRIMVVAIDVTEMLESKRKIQDAEERARLSTAAAGLGTFDLDLRTGEMNTSERFDEIFGYKHHVPRASYVSVIHPDDHEIRLNAHRRALDIGQIYYEVRVIWEDKSIHWIRVQGKIYYDGDGKALRMLGTVMDITQQRNAKEELIRINQRLEIALEAGRFGSYELDIKTNKIRFSDQFNKNYGLLPKKKLTYAELLDFIEPDFKENVVKAINNAILEGTIYQAEYQIRWSDDSIHWIKESGKAQYDEKGIPLTFIGVSFDITETKQLQQQKDDFIGIASHELKTPVTSIKAYAQVLERILLKKGDVMEAGLMKKMDLQLNRLTNLIGDLLDVTKVNSGKLQYNLTHFDFNEMVRSEVEELQRATEKHQIIENLEEVGLVYADRERISQVVTNLLTNAIKYSPNSEKIVVHTMIENDNVVLCVEDFGIGIAETNLNKVFEQFYRVSGSMQHTFPGLGLGLYISSEIIKREGGKIWVSSKEGEGSKFWFSIPIQRPIA
ncbi:PAS domain-containing sensor histidine kinase [Pedobacter boryungensis]|uniref:histidine kinase n=1 Tax=Pedobacter boryungensis TaxID=869962 RepID=A0ABX2DF84_9SPHI|nr:PAS domain-containing sensor histidine kinase [Pedobacter boryungensis]NQX32138.1 PAS domain-containing protein [Pedobacter boryungensis]